MVEKKKSKQTLYNKIYESLIAVQVEEGWWRGKLGVKVGVFPSNFVSMVENASPVLANRRSQSGIITTTSSATAHAALQAAAAEAAAAEAAAADAAKAAAEAAAIQQAAGPVKLASAGSLSASKIYSQSRETLLSEKDAPILPPKPGMTITT